MTNKTFLITAFLGMMLFAGCKNSGNKYFTGTIEYAYAYTSETLNVDSLSTVRPSKGFFRYDATDYQSTFIGQDTVNYYYSGKINRCVSRTEPDGDFQCEDYNIITDSVLSTKLYDTDEKVLGYSCKILELQKRNSRVKYFVSNDLKIAPATYQRHRSYNWDVYGEKAEGGLILKLEHQFKSFTMSGVATDVKIIKNNFYALGMSDKDLEEFCTK